MLRSSLPLKKISDYKIRKVVQLATDFCATHIGKCRNKQFPLVYISKQTKLQLMGEYDPFEHEILIYTKYCKTVGELVKTLIHEWTHSKQRVLTDYQRLHKKMGYINNPLEIEAYAAERVWIRKALKYVRENW